MRLNLMNILVRSLKNATEQQKQTAKLFSNEVNLNLLIATLFDIRFHKVHAEYYMINLLPYQTKLIEDYQCGAREFIF